MKRKIAQIGPSTLMVSLPSEWVRKFGLKKSQEVEVETQDNKVIISTRPLNEPKSTSLDVSKLGPMMLRYLVSIYKKGYDEVQIIFDNPDMISEIQSAIGKEAVGFEIMEQGKRTLVIKNISETLTDFDSTLRRTMRLLVSMADECYDALSKGEFKLLKNVAFLEEANNRFTTTIRRALNKQGTPDFANTNLLYFIVEELEKIADQYKYLCMHFHGKEASFDSKTLELLESTNDCLRKFTEIYYKYDEKTTVFLGEERKRIVPEALDIIENGKKDDRVLAHYVLTIVQQVFGLVGPFLAMRL